MRTKSILACLAALLALGLIPPAAVGKGVRVKGGVVHACLKTTGQMAQRGTIRIVNSARQCKKKHGEQALAWGLLGASGGGGEGARGPQGPVGPAGATGPQGPPGSAASPTVLDDLKQTVADQNEEIEALLGKVDSLTGELVKLENGLGGVKTSVTDLGDTMSHSVEQVKTELNGSIGDLKANVVDPLVTKVATLEPLTAKVAALEPLTAKVEALEPLTAKVAALEPLTGEVGALKTTTDSLTTAVAKQCASLGEVATQANGLGAALDELLGVAALKTLLGGLLPKVPEDAKAVTC